MSPTGTDLGTTIDLNILRQEVTINIPTTSVYQPLPSSPPPSSGPPPPPLPPRPPRRWAGPPNLPSATLLENREDYISFGVPLYKTSITGNWRAATAIFHQRQGLVQCAITENLETALHVAVSAEDTNLTEDFVQNLVNLMEKKDLELQNRNSNTALSLAAAAGSVKMAEIMVKKNKVVLNIPGSQGLMPLYLAALFGKHDMVKYLYDHSERMTGDFWTNENRGGVLVKCLEADIFDVALQIVKDRQELSSKRDVLPGVLLAFARKPRVFDIKEGNLISRFIIFNFCNGGPAENDVVALKLLRYFWVNTMKMRNADIDFILKGPLSPINEYGEQQYPSRILFVAAEMDNTKFIVELIQACPDLIWNKNDDGRTIFHIAVMHCYQGIYNLLYEIGSMKDLITPLIDKDGNNMLHLVGKSSKKERAQTMWGVPMLIQREVLWFKEVESLMPLQYKEKENKAGQTPYELFSKNNKDLVSQGMKWINDCMVVATLIVTVAFAVAFTVPGGYKQDNGIPMFIRKGAFIAFVVADAVSLFSSSASLLVFLSIRTSPYDQRDFFVSLPRKLLIGIITLFISVTAMMVTFSVSYFVLYQNKLKWVPILISVFASMPLFLFAALQHTILVDMFRATSDATYLFMM